MACGFFGRRAAEPVQGLHHVVHARRLTSHFREAVRVEDALELVNDAFLDADLAEVRATAVAGFHNPIQEVLGADIVMDRS